MKKILFLLSSLFFFPFIFVLGQSLQPLFVDVKVSTSSDPATFVDGPLTVEGRKRIFIKWESNATYCYQIGNLSSSFGVFKTNPTGQMSFLLSKPGRYLHTLICTKLTPKPQSFDFPAGSLSDFMAMDYVVIDRQPSFSVDLKINGSDTEVVVPSTTTLRVSWKAFSESGFYASCTASGPNWEGSVSSYGYNFVKISLPSGEYSYTLSCTFYPRCFSQPCSTFPVGEVSDSVKVIVRSQ